MDYGWRAKIGIIVPGNGCALERDFWKYVPDGVNILTNRIDFSGTPNPDDLLEMVGHLESTLSIYQRLLPGVKPYDCIVFGCTSGSLIGGYGFDQSCIDTIKRVTGYNGLTTSTAVVEAFKTLDCGQDVVVLTPYPEATNIKEKGFLEDNGIKVREIKGEFVKDRALRTGNNWYQAAKQMNLQGASALFISCTGLTVADKIVQMEEDFGIPVITSNQATIWAALRHSGVKIEIPELGKLGTK